MSETGKSAKVTKTRKAYGNRRWVRLIRYVIRKCREREAKKEKENAADKASRRTALATVWIAGFTFLMVVVSAATAFILRNQVIEMHQSVRPWVVIDNTPERGVIVTVPFELIAEKQATISLEYWLNNFGGSPANVAIYGEVIEFGNHGGQYPFLWSESEKWCAKGTEDFKGNTKLWAVVPKVAWPYMVAYGGETTVEGREHMGNIRLDSENKRPELLNIGCLVYRSTTGDRAIRHTPFWVTIDPDKTTGFPLMIGRVD